MLGASHMKLSGGLLARCRPRNLSIAMASSSSAPAPPPRYRPNVGICVFNRVGLVFTARRVNDSSGAWQMPQGGIDPGEDAAEAALRELQEETST